MRRAVDQFRKNNKKANFGLQLTAMVDMFTILIVFLLKSYSTSAVNLTPQEGLKLPTSTSNTEAVEALKLVVSLEGVFVDDKKVVSFKSGELETGDVDPSDADFIRPLFKALDAEATKSKEIAKRNEEIQFDGKVIMQADSRLNYKTLKKVLYTSSMAGFADLRLATIALE